MKAKRKPTLTIVKPPPDAKPGDGAADLKPGTVLTVVPVKRRFNVSDEQRGDILDAVADALIERNTASGQPELYNRADEAVVSVQGLKLAAIDTLNMTVRLMQQFNWTSGERDSATDPPYSIAAGVTLKGQKLIRALPPIVGVTGTPTFSADGRFETEPGYHPSTQTYYAPRGLVIPPVPEKPTGAQIEAAKQLILKEMLGDFFFVSDAEKAHTVAMLLLGFVRPMINGATPVHGIDAPEKGTGKGYLVDAVHTVLTGEPIIPTVVPTEEAEWQKMLLSKLVESPIMISLDNIDTRLKSRTLNMMITGQGFSGRLLGSTKMLDLKCTSVLVCTGNNLNVGGELVRRVIRIRMERDTEVPPTWQHADLLGWIAENRGEIVRACATLVNAWLAAGAKDGKEPQLESFTRWTAVMSGILETAGIPGLLGNRKEWNASVSDSETEALIVFFSRWYTMKKGPVPAKDLLGLAWDIGLPLKARSDDAQKAVNELGYLLRANRDRTLGGYKLSQVDKDRNGVALWSVTRRGDA